MNQIALVSLGFIFTVLIDSIYLKFIAGPLFRDGLPSLMRTNIIWWAACMAWFLIVLGSYIFVFNYAQESFRNAVIYGGIFGFVLYGVYEFTNYAIFSSWTMRLIIVDLAWGVILNIALAFFWRSLSIWLIP